MQRPRTIDRVYEDPLSAIWLRTAERIGMRVSRTEDAYASWDGAGTISLASGAELDPDDHLAQMVLHEICHALVEGRGGRERPDWGLDNTDDRDAGREFAALRLQYALTTPYGLQAFMAPTTDWRWYYDQLSDDPLSGDEQAAILARAGMERARQDGWSVILSEALEATARLAEVVSPFVKAESLWRKAPQAHPTGLSMGPGAERCGTCAWAYRGGPGPLVTRCRQHQPDRGSGVRVEDQWPACELWEPPLDAEDCGSCGACCTEGYHLVPIPPGGKIARSRPDLVVIDQHGAHLPRPHGRCVALCGTGSSDHPLRCEIYDDRPRSCREFEVAGKHCLSARRRAGLSGSPRD